MGDALHPAHKIDDKSDDEYGSENAAADIHKSLR